MNKTWKALASVAVAAALVIAPLATTGAMADETPPPDDTVVATEPAAEPAPVADAAPIADAAAETAALVPDPPATVADDSAPAADPPAPAAQSQSITSYTGSTYTPPATTGYVLALWAADTPGTHWPQSLVGSVKTVSKALDALDNLAVQPCTFYQVDLYADNETTTALITGGHLTAPGTPREAWPGGHYQGWYSKTFTTYCPPELTKVTPMLDYTSPTCDQPGEITTMTEVGVVWGAVLNDDDSTTYTASPAEGYRFPDDVQTQWTVPKLDQLPADSDECSEDTAITPTLEWTPPSCDAGGTITFGPEEGVSWLESPNEDGSSTWTASPKDGFAFPDGAQTEWVVPLLAQLPEDSDECTTNVPTIVTYNFAPEPPTCEAAGTFDTALFPIDSAVYTLTVDRPFDGPGTYTITATAKPGFTIEGPTTATITVLGAIGFQSTDSAAPCFLASSVTLGQPTVDDQCGTVNDFAYLPADTEGVTYDWVDIDDPDNFDIIATLADGFVVDPLPAGWVANEDGTFTYAFSPEFSDEDCPLVPGDIGSQCVGSVPYLNYAVSLPEGYVADSDTPLTITFVHPTDPSQNYVVSNLPLNGTLLWPGASLNPPGWPGWELVNGTYVETDGNYAWTRDGVTVLFEVNPSYQTTVSYPPESALCANPASLDPPPLAATGGADMGPWGIGGLAIAMTGLALILTRRLARR